MQRILQLVALAFALAFALGCAAARPLPPYFAGNADHPKFPRARYIAEVGISTSSADDAEARARKNVSERISSVLSSEISSYAESLSGSGGASDSQRFVERIKLTSHFAHAELIRAVERDAQDGRYFALAVLDRAEGDAVLGRDVQQEAVGFVAAAARALAAREQARPGEFSSAAAEADKLREKLDGSFIVRRAVLGHPSLEEEKFLGARDALLKAELDARTRRVIGVRIEGVSSTQLLRLAVSSVRKLGLRVAENSKCADAAAAAAQDTTELVLEPEESCGEGSLGERCEVAVRLHARGCGGGGEGEGRIAQQRGVHPSDRARARQAAWNRVLSEPAVDAAVRDALKGAAYFQCSTPGC